jgi:hypothetical protein
MNLQTPKFTLVAIATLFLIPLLMAVLMRSSLWNFEPSKFANLGTLVEPPLALDTTALEIQTSENKTPLSDSRTWVMLYPLPDKCEDSCLEDVAKLRQIHIATGRKRDRVSIWLLNNGTLSADVQQQLIAVYGGLDILNDPLGKVSGQMESISGPESQQDRGQVFLLDPSANIILRYPADFDPKDIHRDLDRLLTWSSTN